jgi:hypothetical protein
MQAPLNLSGGRPLRDYDLWATVLVFNVPSMGQSVGATTPVAIFAGAEHTGLPRQALQALCGARQCGTGRGPPPGEGPPKAQRLSTADGLPPGATVVAELPQ